MKSIFALGVVALSLAACAPSTPYKAPETRPHLALRTELVAPTSAADSTKSATHSVSVAAVHNDTAGILAWRAFYTDPLLQNLIDSALVSNHQLAVARLRIDEAVAALGGARGMFLPTAQIAAETNLASASGARPTANFPLTASLNWEINLAGRQKKNVAAAKAVVEERQFALQSAQSRLMATVAQAYFTLQMLDARKALLDSTCESWEQQIAMLQALLKAGQAHQGEVAQAEASLWEVKSQLEQVRQETLNTEGQLSLLLGRPSAHIERASWSNATAMPSFFTALPLTALAQRPDVAQAEANLRSAFHQVEVARAAFYPSLRLSASATQTFGAASSEASFSQMANPIGLLLQTVGGLVQPLLSQGQNRANLRMAQAQHQQLVEQFAQTLLEASQEVNVALAQLQTAQRQVALQQRQIDKLQETLRAAEAQMRYGEGNALQILVARQSLLAAQMQQLSTHYAAMEGQILLFRALGGGAEGGK